MLPPKDPKKKGMDVMIAVAPHSKPGLGAPLPVEKSMGKPDDQREESDEQPPSAEHEMAETPADEGNEEYGAKLLSDIESVGKRYGADAETSRALAADFFDAMARCLKGDGDKTMGEQYAEEHS